MENDSSRQRGRHFPAAKMILILWMQFIYNTEELINFLLTLAWLKCHPINANKGRKHQLNYCDQ